MSEQDTGERAGGLVLAFAIDAPPGKVWRAIATPELRARWLPDHVLADATPVSAIAGRELRLRLRDDGASPVGSTVTFRVEPGAEGGTTLTIVHEIPRALSRAPGHAAANGDRPLMRAA